MNERYDHRSSEAISNCKVSLKKNQASTGFERMTFALPCTCKTNEYLTSFARAV